MAQKFPFRRSFADIVDVIPGASPTLSLGWVNGNPCRTVLCAFRSLSLLSLALRSLLILCGSVSREPKPKN